MKALILLGGLFLMACGSNGSGGNGPVPFNGDGLTTAVYTQENGFVDVTICNCDVHQMPNGNIHVSGGNPISQISDANYIQASDGYFKFPYGGPQGQACWFYITNGKFDTTASAIAPTFYQRPL